MLIIGIGHKARQGKDTFARALHCIIPARSWIYHFADPLKHFARVTQAMTVKSGRVLQALGDVFGDEILVSTLLHTIEEDGYDVVLIPDMRTESEYNFVRRMSGITVEIVRLNSDGTRYIDPSRPPDHRTECELDDHEFDYVVQAPTGRLDLIADEAANFYNKYLRRCHQCP
jgi:hypothetical protein